MGLKLAVLQLSREDIHRQPFRHQDREKATDEEEDLVSICPGDNHCITLVSNNFLFLHMN